MSTCFERSAVLAELAVEHGLGTRGSDRTPPPRLHTAKQVHGTDLVEAPLVAPHAASDTRADALWTRSPGLAVGVYTADCVPVLLVDLERRGVAAVHAGWRGSAAQVALRSARRFAREIGASPRNLLAVIGPHIGVCCYEVDEPVRRAVRRDEVLRSGSRPGHYQLDLFELNRLQLLEAGLEPERISRVGGCTCCDATRYSSYRRDGSGERMLHFVRMPLS